MDLRKLWFQFKIMVGLNVIDFLTTLPFLSKLGASGETNPVLRYVIETTSSPGMVIFIKFVTLYFLYLVIEHVLNKREHTILYYSMIIVNLLLLSVVLASTYTLFKFGF